MAAREKARAAERVEAAAAAKAAPAKPAAAAAPVQRLAAPAAPAAKAAPRGPLTASEKALMTNLQDQMNRLVSQLNDLEEMREDLDDAVYEEGKAEALAEMRDFENSIAKMKSEHVSLVGEFERVQLAIQSTIKSTCKTAEVIEGVAKNQPAVLRTKMPQVIRDHKMGKMSDATKD